MQSFSSISIKFLVIICELNNFHILINAHNHKGNAIPTDNLLMARCHSYCETKSENCNNDCIQKYLKDSSYKKYGDCPKNPATNMEAICISACAEIDYRCPGIEKCCTHECGTSCQLPIGLEKSDKIPSIPYNVVTEEIPTPNNRTCPQLRWDMIEKLANDSPQYYVIESRSHIGPKFFEYKLDEWKTHKINSHFEGRTDNFRRYGGNISLKPGRWYQFRVAAVNDLGTKGYSNYSKEFQTSRKLKPPKPPKNLELGPLKLNSDNKTFNRKISWNPPKSDLPVAKYKISWSLYLHEKDTENNESLIKETEIVNEPTRNFVIQKLLPNSTYYLQVQAISIFGRKRLKSIAETTIMNISATGEDMARNSIIDNILLNEARPKQTIKNNLLNSVQIKFVASRRYGMVVKIMWKDNYVDRIILDLCKGTHECLNRPMQKYLTRVATKKNSYSFLNTQYGTTYTVSFRKPGKGSNQTASVYRTFTTPHCIVFQKKYSKIKCQQHRHHVAAGVVIQDTNNKLMDN